MKVRNLFNRIPRPVRACFCVFLSIVLLMSYYVMLDCPLLTMRQHFRRAEKVHMVGSSKIVDVLNESEYGEFLKLYVAESEHGISFFGQFASSYPYDDPFAEKLYYFTYMEKTEDMTLCVAPNVWGRSWGFVPFERSVPAYLFINREDAARVELQIAVTGILQRDNQMQFTEHLAAQSDQKEDGYFRFNITADDERSLDALCYLSNALGGDANTGISVNTARIKEISAVIRVFDRDGRLLTEESRNLYTPR